MECGELLAILGETDKLEYWLALTTTSLSTHDMMCSGIWLQEIATRNGERVFKKCDPELPATLWRDAIIKKLDETEVHYQADDEVWVLSIQVITFTVQQMVMFEWSSKIVNVMSWS